MLMPRPQSRGLLTPVLLVLHALGSAAVQHLRRGDLVLRRRRHPLAALPRRHAHDVHHVHLLEGLAAAFEHAEVDHAHGDEQTARKDVPVGKVDVARDERGEEAN